MFAGGDNGRNILQLQEEDEVINLCDFEFNLNLQTQLQDLESIREFSKQISYIHNLNDENDRNDQVKLSQDDWFMILDYIPFNDYCKFSLVCSAFAELLTFNRRHLVMRGILKDFPSLLKDHYFTSADSLLALASERSPSDDSSFSKSIHSDMINFLLEQKRYKQNLWNFLDLNRIREMDDKIFMTPFRESVVKKTFYDFPDIPQVLLNDREFIVKFFKTFKKAPRFFLFLNQDLMNDEEIIKMALHTNGWFIKFINKPSREIINMAFQSKYRFIVKTSHDPYSKLFERYTDSLLKVINREFYELLDEKSIFYDYRKSLDSENTLFTSILQLDSEYGNKNIEILLKIAYIQQAKELKKVFYNYYHANTIPFNKYLHVDDMITDMICYPEKFESFLSKVIQTPTEIFKCKTVEISISQVLNRILKDNFAFDTLINNLNFKLTKSCIEYLRERLINKLKVTSLFSKLYFTNYFDNRIVNEQEKTQLWNEISNCKELSLKMLKYYPKYYSSPLLNEKFKNENEFKVIAMNDLKVNSQYFDLDNDEVFVMSLSANLRRSVRFYRKTKDRSEFNARMKRIFLDENNRIRKEWLKWPSVYSLSINFFSYYSEFEDMITQDDRLEMMDHLKPKEQRHFYGHFNDERILDKITMKNILEHYYLATNSVELLLRLFTKALTYKSYIARDYATNGQLCKYQISDRLISKILQVVPKFVKVFFKERAATYYRPRIVIDFPYELITELALENPRIVHYLPRNIRKRLKEENPSLNK